MTEFVRARSFGAAAVLLLAAGAPALGAAAGAKASTAAVAGGAVSTAADALDCTAAAPSPILKKSAYRGYSYRPGPENTASEKAVLGSVSLEIQTAGCYDGIEHSFIFNVRSPKASYDDRDYWLKFAADQLAALKLIDAGRDDVKELAAFLPGPAKKAAARKSASELRLEACRDGSLPDEDGCAFTTGGGYRFAVRKIAGGVQVFVSQYVAL